MNLAMLEAAQGKLDEAQRQLTNAGAIDKSPKVSEAAQNLKRQIDSYQRK